MMGVATDLARGKMYDIEEKLLKDGFTDTDQSQDDCKPFDDEGWPTITYAYKVEAGRAAELGRAPGAGEGPRAQQMGSGSRRRLGARLGLGGSARARTRSARASAPDDPLDAFQNSALGGMLGMIGGWSAAAAARDVDGAQGGALHPERSTRCSSRS